MILDFFTDFCSKGNCHSTSPYRCDYPEIKKAHAVSITELTELPHEIIQIIRFENDVLDKSYSCCNDGVWKVWIRLNNKYEFTYEHSYFDARDYLIYEEDVSNFKIDITEFKDGIDIECKLLLNDKIVCPLFMDVIMITDN